MSDLLNSRAIQHHPAGLVQSCCGSHWLCRASQPRKAGRGNLLTSIEDQICCPWNTVCQPQNLSVLSWHCCVVPQSASLWAHPTPAFPKTSCFHSWKLKNTEVCKCTGDQQSLEAQLSFIRAVLLASPGPCVTWGSHLLKNSMGTDMVREGEAEGPWQIAQGGCSTAQLYLPPSEPPGLPLSEQSSWIAAAWVSAVLGAGRCL